MEVTLRGYSSEDFETLYEIDQTCYPSGIAYSRRTLRWFLRQAESECRVALVGSEIGGFLIAALLPDDDETGHIITLDVLERFRRAGMGSALVKDAEGRLAGRGAHTITLETAVNNEAGVAFWKHHGYRTVGIARGYYLGRIDAFAMVKNLVTRRSSALS